MVRRARLATLAVAVLALVTGCGDDNKLTVK